MRARCPLEGVTNMIEMWLSYFEAHNDLYYVAINRCSGGQSLSLILLTYRDVCVDVSSGPSEI